MFFSRKRIGFLLEAVLLSLIVGLLIPFIFLLKAVFSHQVIAWNDFFAGFIFSFVVSFCIYFFNVRIVHKLQQMEKSFRSQFTRILLELVITICISSVVMTMVLIAFMRLYRYDFDKNSYQLFDNIVIAIIVNVVAVFIIEAIFFFKKWKNSLLESEQLRRKNVEIQYAALTSQINPHFLFNSLNALSSLIQADPEKAVVFTREFSKIYRYVLDSKDRLIVSLQEELNFLYSFLYLQKIRYDKGLEYTIEINASCLDLLLPPLSLQLLVENAIKHNEISQENPLVITIKGNNSQVTVSNNYRPIKKVSSYEGGLGLKNLVERYSHYTDIKPDFNIENHQYRAIIPLLKDE
jgi:two-component system LytT family sensor kinase